MEKKNSIEKFRCKECIPILIVDDVPFNHTALKGLLNILNIKCDNVFNGFEGIDLVK
jgi:CheY-like chemotaxis protein